MMEFWFFLALSAIQIIATKVPAGPKGATLKDVEIPKAEDGVDLAYVWGRCRIRDFNVTWHGDLSSVRNKVRQGFKKRVVSWDYWLKWQLAICHGPVNKIGNFTYNEFRLEEQGAGDNEVTDIPDGGQVRYMGKDIHLVDKILQGTYTFRGRIRAHKGHATQAVPAQWKSIVDNNAYRGVVMVDCYQDTGGTGRGAYIGQQPRVLLMTCDVEKTTEGWHNDIVWYPEKLEIPRAAASGYEAYKEVNGAHLLYDVITNPKCGIGADIALIDDANWRAMADICFAENLGLSLEWAKQMPIGEFVDKICDHIKGGVRFNESIGKFQLVLFRANYDPETLTLFNPDNSKLISYAPSGNTERVNEVHLKYTSVPNKFELATISAHDIGAQMTQGAQIPLTIVREGITDPDTARMVLAWECHQQVTPLSKITIEADRRARGLGYAGVFLYQEPKHHNVPRVYRAIEVKSSEVDENKIIIVAVADIFAQQEGGWNIGAPQVPETPGYVPPDPDTGDDSGVGVIDTELTTPPVSPSPGDSYIPAPGATGAWAGLEGQEVTWVVNPDGSGSWVAEPIEDHTLIVNDDTGEWYEYVGGVQLPPPWLPDVLTTKGDLVIFDGDSYERLPAGADGFIPVSRPASALGVVYEASPASLLTTKGDLLVRTASGLARFPVGIDGQAILADSTQTTGLKYGAVSSGGGSGGSGGGGVVGLEESGASLANWDNTGLGGTWTTSGGVIVGVQASGYARLKYVNPLKQACAIFEWEFMIPTASGISASPSLAGLEFFSTGAAGAPQRFIGVQFASLDPATNGQLVMYATGATFEDNLPFVFALDTWHSIKVVKVGTDFNVYVDGAFYQNMSWDVSDTAGFSRKFVNLAVFNSRAHFRNIKVTQYEPDSMGGGSSGGLQLPWVTPLDTIPVSPNAMDDEFNDNSFDTSKWTWGNQDSSTAVEDAVNPGHLILNRNSLGGLSDEFHVLEQTLPAGTWKFRAKMFATLPVASWAMAGLVVRVSGGVSYIFGLISQTAGLQIQQVSTINGSGYMGSPYSLASNLNSYYYLEIERTSTNIVFRHASPAGVAQWNPLMSIAAPTFTTAISVATSGFNPNRIGLAIGAWSSATAGAKGTYDWFRRIS